MMMMMVVVVWSRLIHPVRSASNHVDKKAHSCQKHCKTIFVLPVCLKCPWLWLTRSKFVSYFSSNKAGKNRSDMKGAGRHRPKSLMVARMKLSSSSSTWRAIILRAIMRFFSVITDLKGEEITDLQPERSGLWKKKKKSLVWMLWRDRQRDDGAKLLKGSPEWPPTS